MKSKIFHMGKPFIPNRLKQGGLTQWFNRFFNLFFILLLNLFPQDFFTLSPSLNALEPKSGGTLVFARGADAVRLDPADVTDGESIKVCANLFDSLVKYKEESTEIEPALATHWQVSEGGKKWIFHLRQGVKFHDGTPFNSEAVVFSLKRQMEPAHPEFGGEFIYWSTMFKAVKEVVALDETTVSIELQEPYAPFLANMAMACVNIVSPTAFKKYGKDFSRNPVGTGPFVFHKWIPREKIILKSNPAYWGGAPYLDQVIFLPVEENSVRLLKVATGEADGMDGVSPNDIATIEEKYGDKLTISSQPGMNVGYLALNTQKPPLNNHLVRRAIAMAINKKLLVKIMYRGTATAATNPIPPTLWGYNDELKDHPYNPLEAKKLLTQAGFPKGFEMSLYAMPIPRPYMPQPRKIAQAIQGFLKKIDIDAKIVTFEWGTYLEKTENGEHDSCLLGWTGDNGDPDNFLYVLLDQDNAKKGSASNLSFFQNEGLHTELIKAQREMNPLLRARHYKKAQEIILDQSPMIPLAHSNQMVVFKKSVQGYKIHPTGKVLFHKVWLNE